MAYTGETVKYGALEFAVYTADGRFHDVPARAGIYLLAALRSSWKILYVGEAHNVRERLSTHEKWQAALGLGMTHFHLHLTSIAPRHRRALERRLIAAFDPPLND